MDINRLTSLKKSKKVRKMRFNIKHLSLAVACVWALGQIVAGWGAAICGWGEQYVQVMSSLYIGYRPSFWGAILGGIWAFVDGAIFGAIFAYIYNALEKKKVVPARKKRK